MINFDNRYALFIALRLKTTTIRDKKKASTGENIVISVDEIPFAEAKVEKVSKLKLKELTAEIAKNDGFNNVAELKRVLKRYYPQLTEDSQIYIIHFTVKRILNYELILDQILTISELCLKFSKKSRKEKMILIELLKYTNKNERIAFLKEREKEIIPVLRECYLELKS